MPFKSRLTIMEKGIDFKQPRDSGEVFTKTFSFLSQEFRPLSLAILNYAFPFILIAAIALILFVNRFKPFFTNPEAIPTSGFLKEILFFYFLMLLIFLISNVLLLSTVNNYIALYIEKGRGNFSLTDVSKRIATNFWQILFTVILTGIMTAIGYMFCILPGIYLAVSMCFVYISITYEKKGFGDALSRSFEICHVKWWSTLLLLILIYIIILIVASIPYMVFLYSLIGAFSFPNPEPNFSPEKMIDLLRKISYLVAMLTIISSLLSVIPMVAIALQYFSSIAIKDRNNQIQIQN
jgi:hypothetical protein